MIAGKTPARHAVEAAVREVHERSLLHQLRHYLALPYPVAWQTQYRFAGASGRKWAADIAAVDHRLLIEVQGGTANHGARSHAGIVGYAQDAVRLAEAQIAGFDMLYFTPEHIEDGRALDLVRRWFIARHWGRESQCP